MPVTSMKLREVIVVTALALEALGVRENGKNAGEVVSKILTRAGGKPGMPWCMAYVDFCYEEACKRLGKKPNLNPGLSCSDFVSRCIPRGIVFTDATSAQPGDFMVLASKPGSAKPYKHIGIVILPVDRDGYIHTVEGNTNVAGSHEGDGIYRTRRAVTTKAVYIAPV